MSQIEELLREVEQSARAAEPAPRSQIEDLLREVEQQARAAEQAPRRRRSQIDELLTEVAAEQGYTAADAARDVGVTALRAALLVPQTVIGLADIPTGGRVGRFLEDRLGIRPQEAARIAAGWASDELQLARQRVEDAEGFVETLGAAARDPAVVAAAVAESLPSVALGGLIGRGITKVAPKVNRWAAGAAGEGAVAAGATASEIRDQTEDRLLTPGQAAAALGAGAGTALVGGLGGRLAQRAGLPDVDTWAAGGGLARGPGSAARMVGAAAATEGAEELVQSGQEQAWQNLALDRPLLHNVGDAAAMGLVTGVPMGAGVGAYVSLSQPAQATGQPARAAEQPAADDPGRLLPRDAEQDVLFDDDEIRADGAEPDPLRFVPGVDAPVDVAPAEPLAPDAGAGAPATPEAAPEVEPQQPARVADFWSWARAQYGLVPAQITVGSPVHAALKAEYDALRQPPRSQIDELLAQVDAQQAAPPAAPDADLGAVPADRAALQPRDRSRAASVVQMAEIARAPDYLRLGPSRTPEAGAPMAFAVGDDTRQIRPEQLGREDVAVMSDGQRVPFRYAVVEAPSVQPSHFADGRANPAFDAQVPGQIKALNNARTAGVRAAFELGTSEPYVAGLKADAALHGVSAETIARMRQPMLVRLYSERDNTRDIGARSQGQTLAMSPAELARQDAPLLDSTVLEAWQPGDVASAANRDFVRAFVGRLRAAGQDTAALMQADGQLSQDGRRRIQAALMQAAYADSALVEEMFDSTDTDIKAAGEALRNVAGAWASLRDSARAGAINPAADVSDNLMQALHLIQRARRERRGLADLVNQPDLLTGAPPDAVTQGMLRLFYDGQYLTRPVGRARLERSLQDYVAAAAATRAGADMFGQAPAGPIEILAAITGAQHEPAAQVGAQDRTREPDGRGDPGHDPGAQRAAGGQQQLGAGRAAVAATGLGQQRADADTAAGARVALGHRAGDGGAGPAPGLADAGRAAAPADARAADARGVRAGTVQDAPAAALTAPDVAREPEARQDQPYETDLFGQPLPRVFHARRGDRSARPDGAGLRGNVHPAAAVPGQAQGRQADTPAAPGDYFVRTVVGRSAERQLGAGRILTPADAAQATAYLYRSAVERFDGIVTDDAGRPLAVIGGFKGGAAETPVNIPTLLAEAVRVPGAARVWFSHNHPTGRAQLSAADMRIEARLSQAFRGSGIEPMGLLAVAGKRFAHTAGADSSEGDVPAAGVGATVPVIERELRPNDTAVREITSSGDAADVAQIFYRRARVPGVILLNYAHAISAWVPLPPQAAGELRATGGLNAIYRAVSEANASAAVIVHGGELAHEVKGGASAAQNVGAALDFAGVRVLDVITVGPDGQTRADSERGIDFKRGPVFSRRSAQQDRDLVIAHSLSAENLLHAAKMGGIPVPSLAVTRRGESITNFGEITLIGDPAMADPRGGAQVFGADIYSPRYPRVERELDRRAVDALARRLAPMAKRMGLRLEVPHSELQTDGQRTLEREPVVMGTFLVERGIEPQVVPEAGFTPEQRAALEASALAPYLSRTDAHGLTQDAGFARAAVAQYRATLGGRDALVSALDRDEDFQGNVVRDMARKVARDAQLRERPQADEYETRRALERQIEQAGLANEFQQYVLDQLEAVTKSERIFDGYTAAGRRRYLPHTLDNVVRLLKRDLRGGEGAIAGAGAVRARVTPRFRSVEQIRRSRDRLIPAEQFEAVRDEINTEFLEVARAFSQDMPSNTAAAILERAATRGVRAAAREMGHEISDAAAERASQFLAKLRNLPTAYFEAKIPRVVGLGEFRAAVVPEGVTPRALEALRAAGVDDIRTYPKGDTAARRAAVEVAARDAGAVFARRAAQRGMPTAEASRIVEAIRALWANAPEVEVVASMQDAAVPEAVRQHDAQQRSAGAAGEPEGFFYRGKVYIVAGTLNRPADVVRVLFHEALGHYGLRGVFGGRLDAILDQIAHVRAPEMRAKATQYGLPITLQEARSEVASLRREAGKSELAGAALDQAARALLTASRRQVAEEVLAEMAQTRPELGFVKRAIAAIKTWLREHVPGFEGLALSDAEIVRSFIVPARNWVERGGGDAEAGPTHFSRAPQGGPQAAEPAAPDARDVAFSRESPAGIQKRLLEDVPRAVTERLVDLTTSQRKFNRWWHRTIGTQLHKAKINRDFARVFYAVQDYMKDVSRIATLAASHAPDLLPQMDSLADVRKWLPHLMRPRARAADIKAASDALFDGTLRYVRDEQGRAVLAEGAVMGGVIWTNAELRARGLTDAQIALYRQARAAIDQSLDSMLAADVYRSIALIDPFAVAAERREHAALMRRLRLQAASETPRSALTTARRALHERGALAREQVRRLAEAGARADQNLMRPQIDQASARARALLRQIDAELQSIAAKEQRIDELKAQGYAPLKRFGVYAVDVLDAEGQRTFFGLYETQLEANRAARRFREMGLQVKQTIKAQRDFEALEGVSPETAMLFADMLGVERTEAMQEWLREALAEQSALKHHIRRKGIEGFDPDAGRVVAAFVTSNARAASRALHGRRIQDNLESITDGDVKDEARKLTQYVNDPREEAQAIRTLLFVYYIGGSVASAIVNLTQTLVQTYPYLAQYGGAARAAARVGRAVRLALGRIDDPDLAAAVARAERDGVIKPQEVFMLQAEASRNLGSDVRVRAALAVWASFFQMAEQFNRRVAFIAGYLTAKGEGQPRPFAFAENAVDETQSIFNKGNRPNWARGALGATLFTFKTFLIQYVEFLARLPLKERALALAVLVMLSGLRGLPFAEDAEDLIDTVAQRLGYSFTTRKAMQDFADATLGEGLADLLLTGVSGTGALPFDVSQRLGMADLLPATGLLKPSTPDTGRQVLEVFGVPGSFVRDLTRGEVRPIAIRNAAKGWEMYQRGIFTDQRGRKVMEVTPVDAAFKAIGLQPSKVARESRAIQDQVGLRTLHQRVEREIAEEIALGIFEDNDARVQRAYERLESWNHRNPDHQIVIGSQAIDRRVADMQRDRAERFIRGTPPELRDQMRDAIEGSR
jgi:hypothetical protein